MALSLTDLQTLRDSLSKAIYAGVLEVTIDGMTTKYASVADMERRRALLDADIVKISPAAAPTYSFAQFSKDGHGNNPKG